MDTSESERTLTAEEFYYLWCDDPSREPIPKDDMKKPKGIIVGTDNVWALMEAYAKYKANVYGKE